MKERHKAQLPLKVIQNNKNNDSLRHDSDDKSFRNNPKKKSTRKIIRAGSLVKSNMNTNFEGRNHPSAQDNDFSK